jgi:hypothetical protein
MHLIPSLIALLTTSFFALTGTTDFCFGCHETPTPSETSFCFGCHETSTSTSAEPSFCFDADCQTPTYTPTSFSFSGPSPSQSQVPVKAEWTLEIFPESDRCNSEDELSVRSLLLPPLKLTRKYRSLTLLARTQYTRSFASSVCFGGGGKSLHFTNEYKPKCKATTFSGGIAGGAVLRICGRIFATGWSLRVLMLLSPSERWEEEGVLELDWVRWRLPWN